MSFFAVGVPGEAARVLCDRDTDTALVVQAGEVAVAVPSLGAWRIADDGQTAEPRPDLVTDKAGAMAAVNARAAELMTAGAPEAAVGARIEELRVAIGGATSLAALQSIDLDTGWPSPAAEKEQAHG